MAEKEVKPSYSSLIASVEIDAIIKGALMHIIFVAGTNPSAVPHILREIDPGAQFRDTFSTRGSGAPHTTLSARALVLMAEARGDMTFIKITATTPEGEDLTINVPKKKAGTWLPEVEAIGRVNEKTIAKIKTALETKKAITTVLAEAEQFGVAYWKAEDGAAYLDSMSAEPPTAGGQQA